MLRNYRSRLLFLCCMACPLAQAANMDLTTFTLSRGPDLGSSVVANYAYLDPGSSLGSSFVSNIASFDWNFSAFSPDFVLASFQTSSEKGGSKVLATTDTVNGAGSTSWQTYTFATPFTGSLSFTIMGGAHLPAALKIQNVVIAGIPSLPTNPTIPAVPEPESYAMLVAGLGLMATIGRRRAKRASRTDFLSTQIKILTMHKVN
jgi:hypothetical protein